MLSMVGKIYLGILVERVGSVTESLIDEKVGFQLRIWVCKSSLQSEVDLLRKSKRKKTGVCRFNGEGI